ncbi:phosphotransferase [Natronincola ferrireducens]|uniref:Phosphotransferase enzyme family protein n=1 Tax=Natronincola ferrireducens TaxID=393762 RepID=A0A1G9EHM4_9FIRM|nr:phosphotransferase [Natronincola ferrireducens]SDK75649.1 Phosphotransferase enzyme family protein [Natronincola ferrireducens]
MLKNKLKSKIQEYLLAHNTPIKKFQQNNKLEVDFLAQGEYNINFTIKMGNKKYVFRVNTSSQLELENQIQYEYNALKALEISGVTPKVYYVDDSKNYLDYGVLIMEFLEGRPLEYQKDLNKAAKIFGRIHSLTTNSVKNNPFILEENIFSDRIVEGKRLLKNYLQSPIVDKELRAFFNKFIEWAEKNSYKEKYFIDNKWHVINNTEVNSHNFIIGEERSYLIDWEKPVISDPCQDLTQFLAITTTLWKTETILSKEEKEIFFKTYIANLQEGDKDIRERVHLYTPYLYLRALSWCAYAWLEYQNPDKDIKNMDTFRKIKSYLDINFMENLLREYK